ncbi:protein polybromo-1-like [Oopsacas minuta]|uniref:Protein polybromo-1-like n=1 Tax=Oopsacas minuta TaxID=111878 RepID=A0AAV7KL19_9METZ|nr:protein polybromo-1-like [Oopsacas minuta]
MNRNNRNRKRPSTLSTQPVKQSKLSPSNTPSPNSDCTLTDTGNNTYSIGIIPVSREDIKTLFYFILDVILSFDRTQPSTSTEKSFEWVTDVRHAIDTNTINSLVSYGRILKDKVPDQDIGFKAMVNYSDRLLQFTAKQKPNPNDLNKILSPLLKARENSTNSLNCEIILEPLCPTEHGNFYVTARRPGLCLSVLRERINGDEYSETWVMLLELVILLEDTLSYFQDDTVNSQHINSLIQILQTSLHTNITHEGATATSTSVLPPTHAPSPVVQEVSESQKAHYSSIINQLYQFIIAGSDTKGAEYISHFKHVPLKSSKSDYHSRIKKPIDLSTISDRIQASHYNHYNEFLSDIQLMCYNTTVYYPHTNRIHTLAISLIQFVTTKLNQLIPVRKDMYPDPQKWLQDTISDVFTHLKEYRDEAGRDVGLMLYRIKWQSRHDDTESIDMTSIEESILSGEYSRYDLFQKELLLVFRRVQGTFSPSSPEYKAMLKLQAAYFELRDKFCLQLKSPCLKVTMSEFEAEMNAFSPSKTQRWIITQKSDYIPEPAVKKEDNITTSVTVDEPWIQRQTDGYESHDECDEQSRRVLYSFIRHGIEYKPGDYVYIAARKTSSQPHIVQIDNIWQTPTGECWLFGLWFYRPEETFHLATKKFFEKEVFKTDDFHMCRSSRVNAKCYVMHLKSFSKFMPNGYSEEDVYVCQSKYNVKTRTEKKIKTWPVGEQRDSDFILRDTPLLMQRIPSVFVNSATNSGLSEGGTEGQGQGDKSDDEEYTNISTQHLPQGAPKGFSYFDQCVIDGVRFKLGDFVYVKVQDGSTCIVRIDQIWHDKSDNPFFTGPWILKPKQTQHPPTQLFYRKEVIMSTTIDTNPMRSIIGKCYVMPLKDYCDSRPIEYLEKNVFVCVYRYYETGDKEFKKIKTFKSFPLAPEVARDEFYKFESDIIPELRLSPNIQDFLSGKRKFTPLCHAPVPSNVQSIPVRKILPTHGYGMFCSFNRSKLQQQNPNLTVPQLTKMLAAEWRSLNPEEKTKYERMASERNKQIEKLKNSPGAMVVYECTWGECDYQFENVQDLFSHVKNKIVEQGVCKWGGCHKNTTEFLSASKLLKHVKEAHIRTSSKLILPSQKTEHFIPSQNSTPFTTPSHNPANLTSQYSSSPYTEPNSGIPNLPPLGTQTILEAIYSSLDFATSSLYQSSRGAEGIIPNTHIQNENLYSKYISSLQHPCTHPINDLSDFESPVEEDNMYPEVSSNHPPLEEVFDSKILASHSQSGEDDESLRQLLREYMDQVTYSHATPK